MSGREDLDGLVGMTGSPHTSRVSDRLVSRRGAWIALGASLLALVVLFGIFGGAQAPVRTAHAPVDSESSRVSDVLDAFPDSDRQPVLVVATRDDDGAPTLRASPRTPR